MTADERTLQPVAFLGHGSPMNAVEHNRFTEAWRTFGGQHPEPRAILAISAHWFVPQTAVTAMSEPRTVHDFSGFPDELFAVKYAAPGSPEVAAEVRALLADGVGIDVELDESSWGLDHGTWSVLIHAFPEATIPVVQLSLDTRHSLPTHVEIGRCLAPLREQGVCIVGSGNLVHNLRLLDWGRPDAAFDWAVRFGDAAHAAMNEGADAVLQLQEHPDFSLAAPTLEHFLPLLYLAGLADAAGVRPSRLVNGYTFGSISMDAYAL